MRDELNVEKNAIAGSLGFLWTWIMKNAPDGDLSSFSSNIIARDAAEWSGDAEQFVTALIRAQLLDYYLDRSEQFLVVHDWDAYQGRLIEKRDADNARRRKSRDVAAMLEGDESASITGTNDEKMRHASTRIMEEYPNKKDREKGLQAIEMAMKRIHSKEDKKPEWMEEDEPWPPKPISRWLLRRAFLYARSTEATRQNGRYVPYAVRWFNNKRYLEHETIWESRGDTDGASQRLGTRISKESRLAEASQFGSGFKSARPLATNEEPEGDLDVLREADDNEPAR